MTPEQKERLEQLYRFLNVVVKSGFVNEHAVICEIAKLLELDHTLRSYKPDNRTGGKEI